MAKITDGKDIQIIIGADDQTKAAFNSAKQGMENMGSHVRKLHHEMDKLTSASDYAAEGLKRMHHMVVGFTIGFVTGAVHEFVSELIDTSKEAERAAKVVDELRTALEEQAKAWKLLPSAMNEATQASVNAHNVKLNLLKLEAVDRISSLKKQLEELQKFKNEIEKNITTHPWVKGNEQNQKAMEEAMAKNKKFVEKSTAQQRVAIAETIVEIEKWEAVLKRQPAALEQVNYNLSKNAEELVTVKIEEDIYEKREKLIDAVLLETEKLGASKEKLIEIETRLFLAGGAEIEQLERYVQALEAKSAKEKEIALAKKMEAEKPPAQPKPATVPINMQMDNAEITRLQSLIALHEEYNRIIYEGNQTIEDRIIKAAAMGVIGEQEMIGMLAQIEVQKIELGLKQAMQSALVQYILGQQSLEQALKIALAQQLANIAAEAAVRALWETALGFAAMAGYDVGSAGAHFQAASIMAAIAAGTGFAAHGLAKSAGVGTGPQGSFDNPNFNRPSPSALTGGSQKQGNVTYVYYINAMDTQTFSEYVKRNSGAITGVVAQDIKTRGEVSFAMKGNA